MKREWNLLRAPLPVLLDPVLRLGGSRARSAGPWSLPQREGSRVLLTFSGTAAVYQAAIALGMRATDKVLLPAYNCGHEVEPFLRAGARVDFYRVDRRLAIDVEDLAARIDDATKAVLVTHYFGFPQPLAEICALCDRHGIALIEDCAHALFSSDGDTPLGLAGDLAVYSLRKTLPLPHGGALVCHNPRLKMPRELPAPPALSTLPKWIERYQKACLLPANRGPGVVDRAAFVALRLLADAARGMRAVARTLGTTQFDPDDESYAFPAEPLYWGIAPSVARLLERTPAPSVALARRRNYAALLEMSAQFGAAVPLLPALPAGVVPLYFPLIADDVDPLLARLWGGAVAAIQWWGTPHPAVPWHAFPDADYLKAHVIAIPLHQDLQMSHMRAIARAGTLP